MRNNSSRRRGRAAMIAIWVLTVLLAFEFVMVGGQKFFPGPSTFWHREFARLGLPSWSVVVVGAIEFGSAMLVLIPRFAALGGAGLAITMIGATGLHLVHEGPRAAVATTILAAMSLVLLRARASDLRLPHTRSVKVAAA